MIQSANNYPISEILSIDKEVQYIIPKYQREYVWGKWNWESLFDDILENEKGHFLGSIICINQGTDALEIKPLELVDGQQRTTTISLLYAAICLQLEEWHKYKKENEEEPDEDELYEIRYEIKNIKNRVLQKSDNSRLKLEPSYQRGNYQDYLHILKEAKIISTEVDKPLNVGNRRLSKAFWYFYSRFDQQNEKEEYIFQVKDLKAFLEKLNAACLVKIEVSNHSDAFTLFETLNNRGIPLSALDLIKNKLLSVLKRDSIGTIDDNFLKWNKLLENLSENEKVQQRYLRHYYNAFKVKSDVAVKSISRATRSNLIKIYSELIESDASKIFEDLHAKSKLYSRLIIPENEDNGQTLTDSLLDLERIGGVPSYSFLLYILSEFEMSEAEFSDIIDTLVKYFVRRNLTDTPPTRDLDKIFMNLIEYSTENAPTKESVTAYLKDPAHFASDELFREKLSGNIYDDNSGATRFILCKIEETNNKTRELYTDLWKRNHNGTFIWTIEHIFPQGKNIPQPWVDMIADGDSDLAKKHREEFVHKLGNLTVSGYNSKLSNLPFSDKRDRMDKGNKNYLGYKNGLYLNEDLAKQESWTIEQIQKRTKELIKLAEALFQL